jgi:hypothetical protein
MTGDDMSRDDQALAKIDVLHAELRTKLLADLPRVAAGSDALYFFNADHNPFDFSDGHLSRRGAEAYELARELSALRKRVGLTEPSVAEKFLECVRAHADTANANRLGAKRLATDLLATIRREEAAQHGAAADDVGPAAPSRPRR